MKYKKRNKILSAILSVIMILSLAHSVSVLANEQPQVNAFLEVSNDVNLDGIGTGETFKVNISLDLEEEIASRGGLYVVSMNIFFDNEVLEAIDPSTLMPVTYDENGKITEGKYYIHASSIEDTALTVNISENRDMFRILYADQGGSSILESGAIIQLAFKVNSYFEVVNSAETLIKIDSFEAAGIDMILGDDGSITNTSAYTCNALSTNKTIKIRPPFKMPNVTSKRQNDILEIGGVSSIGTNSDEPLTITITDSNGNIVMEEDATLSSNRYKASILLDENIYAPGQYILTLTHGATSASKVFDVKAKYDSNVPPVVEPDEPDVPEEPDEPGVDEPSTDNSGSGDSSDKDDNTNAGTSGSGNSSSNNSGAGINLGGNKLPSTSNSDSKTDTSDADKKEEKPEILYPSDIDGHWANDNIKYVYDNSLMNGYSDGTFGPDNNITRAEFVTVMARLHGYTEDTAAAAKFTDVSDHWAKGYIGALASMGIVGGVSDTEFAPDENITREQIAAILSRALALTHGDITVKYADDSAISDWAYDSVYSVFEAGYMKGDTANNFNPLDSATRAEVATIIYRLHSAQ